MHAAQVIECGLSQKMGVNVLSDEMEAESKCLQKEEEEEELPRDEGEEEEEEETLKTRICRHPLYGLLVQTHLNCLRVGAMGEMERNVRTDLEMQKNKSCLEKLNQPDLDRFMEEYCFALEKLKEAMEEPQLKSMAFINKMHSQQSELSAPRSSSPAEQITTPSETSEQLSVEAVFQHIT